MASPLTIILNSINKKTDYLDEIFIEENYVPFLVNKIMASFQDTVLYANDMDKNADLSKQMQYDYYYYGVRKRNRFSPWVNEIIDPDIEIIQNYYDYSLTKAQEVLRIISDSKLDMIRKLMTQGGRI